MTKKKLKPLAEKFDTKAFIQSGLNKFSKLSGYRCSAKAKELFAPIFDIEKLYENYYKEAMNGKITPEIVEKHSNDFAKNVSKITVAIKTTEIEVNGKQMHFQTGSIENFDIFFPLMPMIHQFCLSAALANAYLELGDQEQSQIFATRTVNASGSLDRYCVELQNIKTIDVFSEVERTTLKEKEEILDFENHSYGGATKKINANLLASQYWSRCTAHPKFQEIVDKHRKKGIKFSDELYDLLNLEAGTDKSKKIRYGREWFYENVVRTIYLQKPTKPRKKPGLSEENSQSVKIKFGVSMKDSGFS